MPKTGVAIKVAKPENNKSRLERYKLYPYNPESGKLRKSNREPLAFCPNLHSEFRGKGCKHCPECGTRL